MYKGDIALGQVLNWNFTSRDSTGTPSTMSGVVLSIYRDNGTTEFTTGLSLTTDFDSRVGLNHVLITTSTSTANFLEGHDYDVVVTAGQVSTVTVVGEVVGQFSVSNRYGGALVYGKLPTVASTSQVSFPSTATTDNDSYNGAFVVFPAGPGGGQARYISDYTGATNSAQLDSALGIAVTSATTAVVYAGAPTIPGSINSIVPGTYSGVTVGAGDYIAKDMSSKLTVGVGIAAPSVVTVRLGAMDYSSVVTTGVGIAAPSLVTVQVQATSVVSSNVKFINSTAVVGDGSATPWGP